MKENTLKREPLNQQYNVDINSAKTFMLYSFSE